MTTRIAALVTAIATTILVPAAAAWASPEHAQRVALEVAVRRAQVRAAVCEQQRRLPPGTPVAAPRLPSSPPVGTAGPVVAGDCSAGPWPFGR